MSIFVVGAWMFASACDAEDPHKFWGSATAEPGPGIQVAKRSYSPPAELTKSYPVSRYRLYKIDLDKDGKDDFIAESIEEPRTCFIKSDLTLKNCEEDFNLALGDGSAYEYFVDLDRSEMLYLLNLTADEDYDDYTLERFDKKTWKRETLARVQPLVNSQTRQRKGIYWGYPWDIRGLPTKVEDGVIKVQGTVGKSVTDDLLTQETGPSVAILFDGFATQGGATGGFDSLSGKLRFVSLKELLGRYAQMSKQPDGTPRKRDSR